MIRSACSGQTSAWPLVRLPRERSLGLGRGVDDLPDIPAVGSHQTEVPIASFGIELREDDLGSIRREDRSGLRPRCRVGQFAASGAVGRHPPDVRVGPVSLPSEDDGGRVRSPRRTEYVQESPLRLRSRESRNHLFVASVRVHGRNESIAILGEDALRRHDPTRTSGGSVSSAWNRRRKAFSSSSLRCRPMPVRGARDSGVARRVRR